MNINDIIGKRYGKLIVVSYSRKVNRHHKYICRCDCGNTTKVFRDNLLSNHKISCSNCWKVLKEGNYYKYICSNGKSFLFSVEDYELVTKHRWHIDSHGYPKTNINHSTVLLSRLIMNCSDNHYIDHINRNPLDNMCLSSRKCIKGARKSA